MNVKSTRKGRDLLMRKSVLYPALALILGAITAGLRMWQRSAGYDASGLPVRFAIPSVVLTVFLILCAGGALFLALRQPKALEDQDEAQPHCNNSAMLLTAAGILTLASGVLNLLSFFRSYLTYSQVLYASRLDQQEAFRTFLSSSLLTGLLAVASVPTAAALLLRAKQAKSGEGKPRPFAVLMPPIFCWLWLIEVYRGHTSNPILWDYVLLLLAVVVLLAGAYERAGFAFGVGKPRRTTFSSLMALLLALAALPDCGGAANALTILALTLHAVAELIPLLSVLEYAPRRLAGDDPEPDSKENAPHEQ